MDTLSRALPEALVASLSQVKGFDEASFRQVHLSGEQVTSVRVNPAKWSLSADKLLNAKSMHGGDDTSISNESSTALPQHAPFGNTTPVKWCPFGLYLPERPFFTHDPYLHAGMYYVQEASSMFLWEALKQTVGPDTQGLKVLDLCAAPGGKSTLLAGYFNDGLLVSNEVIKARASILEENIVKWGTGNVVVTNNDPKDFQRLAGYFDVMVIDAPCSGSGLFRRDAKAIDEWSEENVQLCSQRQQRILADAIDALKEEGMLIYSTCSYSMEEDEAILDWCCSELSLESIRFYIPDNWHITEVQTIAAQAYGYRFYPDKIRGEGFFIAAFRKPGEHAASFKKPALTAITKAESMVIKEWLNREDLFFFKQKDQVLAIAAEWQNEIALLQKHLYLRLAGVTVGSIKGKELVPHHALAMSVWKNEQLPAVELDLPQALNYLKKKDVVLPPDQPVGWTLAKYQSASLGWMKVLPNRMNNYYPVEWRILKD